MHPFQLRGGFSFRHQLSMERSLTTSINQSINLDGKRIKRNTNYLDNHKQISNSRNLKNVYETEMRRLQIKQAHSRFHSPYLAFQKNEIKRSLLKLQDQFH